MTLKGRPWTTFVDGYEKGEYPVFGRGWYPDFPDADNYISPFVSAQNALGTPYESPQITDKPLPESRREIDRTYAVPQFREVQQILAGDARLIPLWQGKQYLAAHKDISARDGRWTRRRS